MSRSLVALLLAALFAAACTSARSSPECKEVCRKHARCAEDPGEQATGGAPVEQKKFDQSECIADCSMLLRDREGRKMVEQHVACVQRAADNCPVLLECQ